MDAVQNDYFKVTGTWQKLEEVVQSFVFESVPVCVPPEWLEPSKKAESHRCEEAEDGDWGCHDGQKEVAHVDLKNMPKN